MHHPLRACTFILLLLAALAALAPAALGQRADGRLGALTSPEIEWARLLSSTPAIIEDVFGHAVAIDGDTAVVGMPWGNGRDLGMRLRVRPRRGGLDLAGGARGLRRGRLDHFGMAVALQGDTAGHRGPLPGRDDEAPSTSSRAAATTWTERQKLTAARRPAGDQFGSAVAHRRKRPSSWVPPAQPSDPDGGQGAVYAFTSDGTTWSLQQKFTSSDGGDVRPLRPGARHGR